MFSKKLHIIFLFVFASLITIKANAEQTNKTVLAESIQQARANGVDFKSFSLFSITTGEKHDVLNDETLLLPVAKDILKLYETRPAAVSLMMEAANGQKYRLDMLRSNPLATDANIGYIDANGRHPFAYDRGVHYQGAVAGSDLSLAAVSVFANGEVMVLFANEEGNFVTGQLEDNSGRYILYNDKDFTVTPPSICATDDVAAALPGEDGTGGGDKTTAAYECKKVRLYWEADYDLYTNKQSNANFTQIYLAGLFNQVQTMYRNENIAVELKSVDVWTVPDNYANSSSSAALNEFRNRWNTKGNNFDGDIAMLLARDQQGNGGIAALDVLCYRPSAYAYGDINGTFSTVPTYSWDVMMVTHEIGHNLGSPHTHWCGWGTGPGGSCGSIDDCVQQQGSVGCSSCSFSTFSNSQPASAWKGTVMSYCHLASRGVSLANGFGPLPGALIRDNVGAGTCLSSIISAKLVTTPLCRDTGVVAVAIDSSIVPGNSHFGTNPLQYKWSNGASTQNIMVNAAGSYVVTITDSNGCSVNLSASLIQNTDDSCKPSKVSVPVIERQYISIYPNPAHSSVMVKFFSNAAEAVQVKLTDITGKTVLIEDINAVAGENNKSLSLSGISAGMYFINISSADTQYKGQKLVVQ